MWHALQDMILMIHLDKPVEGLMSHYGPNFHSVSIEALEEIDGTCTSKGTDLAL
jgi:hypothetical protein